MTLHFANAYFRNSPKGGQRQPSHVLIRQREYAHDVAVLTFDYEKIAPNYTKDSPVQIVWGYTPADTETFTGYVHHSEQHDVAGETRRLKVFCIGASRPMDQAKRRSFQRLNVGGIISRIAKEHRLAVQMDPSSRFHEHIPQLGRTNWNLCVALAKDIGFTFGCRGTTLYFKRRVIDTRPGRQPTFRLRRGVTWGIRGSLYSLVHKAGSAPMHERRVVQVDGVDDQGRPLTMVDRGDCCDPDKPIFTSFVDDEPVHSIHDGRELLSGLSNMNRFYVIAKAKMAGSPKVRPGMTIQVLDVSAEANGYWWTGSVDHIITPREYRMEAEIGRETVRQTVYEPLPASDAGKPQLTPELGVEEYLDSPPSTEYNPLDDCRPVEELVHNPFGDPISVTDDPLASPARQLMRAPRPSRPRGCCPPDSGVFRSSPLSRLNGWRATSSVTRTTS